MTKNKSVDLGIDTFMQSVAENKPAGTMNHQVFLPEQKQK